LIQHLRAISVIGLTFRTIEEFSLADRLDTPTIVTIDAGELFVTQIISSFSVAWKGVAGLGCTTV
jgi:hypothetical protein